MCNMAREISFPCKLLTQSGELERVCRVNDVNVRLEVQAATGVDAGVLHHCELERFLNLISVLIEHHT